MFWPLIGWLHMSLLHLFGVCLVTMCVMIYCPHYLTSVVTPANQCVITVIIVIMFLETRYTWRHTRPHLMTITASFLEQIILVRRYFNQIISILSLNNITSMMWPASHSKEAISSHIALSSNSILSWAPQQTSLKAQHHHRASLISCGTLSHCHHNSQVYQVWCQSDHCCCHCDLCLLSSQQQVWEHDTVSQGDLITLGHCVHWSLFIVLSVWSDHTMFV